MEITLNTPLTEFPGVGEVRAKKLEKLGLVRCADLISYFPRDYEDRRQVYSIRSAPLGQKVCISAMAAEHPRLSRIRKGLDLVKLKVVDQAGALHITFFNQGYVERALRAGEEYIFYGVVEEQGSRRTMVNPIFERVGKQNFTGCIVPVYPLTAGITNHLLCTLTQQAVAACAQDMPETLPRGVRLDHELAQAEFSYRNIHFPESFQALELARRRLTFEELFYLSAGLAMLKGRRGDVLGCAIPSRPMEEFLARLPFPLTGAQRRVMEEISRDMASGRPMNRLVQGDVGSGKTVVAAYAAWLAAGAGYQSALMAPTEVLAEQHFRSLSALLEPAGVRVGLLTGSITPAGKKKVRQALAAGEIDLIIGTHALLSQGVEFAKLGLMVADEQHRFGVAQRAALAAKGDSPHVLVMSATPIPRTLALIIYGDLDVSVIDELPPGRTPVETYVVREDKRARMYNFVRRLVGEGRQVYIICPAVEENTEGTMQNVEWEGDGPALDLKAVTTYAKKLQTEVFPDLRVDFLHGKMKPREKEAVMAAFAAGETQVLVSTTVIEVGVDVPNAALIIIENAERFGLSQLHQLRGRVGRGKHQSYCVLITNTRSVEAMQRLRTLASTADGFKISEEDLKLRGPGDFFGSRQHGLPQMKLADLAGDMRLLSEAQESARRLLMADPTLSQPENRPVLERVRTLFADTPDIFN
ncbi:MAG TPA: ATP-dependent DNA helicase RecG [Candidatus Lawsonibacter pullicola]|nr:ATP-dependent DNA helicase RecG [Pseudoflavonifractor sp. An184]OUP55671.1 ATP-dependent DNA helicase RecG [Pseudoflavonifractor sp. An184]HIW26607.1 ATP-dependent DNA helicase RecG [Candidatus Lawsonibacter pullicola]